MNAQVAPPRPEFHAGWEEWLAANLLKRVPEHRIVEVMVRKGFDPEFIRARFEEMAGSPVYRAAVRASRIPRKLESLVEALAALQRQSGTAGIVPEEVDPTPETFYERYFYPNRPVVLKGLMRGWPALETWTPEGFAQRFGDVDVEITSGRESDEDYERRFSHHRTRIRMDAYVRLLLQGGATNDYYLVSKNGLLQRSEFASLYDDFACPQGILDPAAVAGRAKLWFGPEGTITPLHHDACSILFGQVHGRKRVRLIHPFDLGRVYNDRDCFSPVKLEAIDHEEFPRMRDVPIYEAVVEPGDFLLLPLGWWHWVESLSVSISLSFTNFASRGPLVVWGWRR